MLKIAQEHLSWLDYKCLTSHVESNRGSTAKHSAKELNRCPRINLRENLDRFNGCNCNRESNTKKSPKLFLNGKVTTSNLYRAYSFDVDKYPSATNDRFKRKLMFKSCCQKISLSSKDFLGAFSVMLVSLAQVFYYEKLHEICFSLEKLDIKLETKFKTPERTRALVREQGTINFQ